jgi:hypothetical protein
MTKFTLGTGIPNGIVIPNEKLKKWVNQNLKENGIKVHHNRFYRCHLEGIDKHMFFSNTYFNVFTSLRSKSCNLGPCS